MFKKINSNDIDIERGVVTIKIPDSRAYYFLKLFLKMGYKNLLYDGEDIYGLKLKTGRGAYFYVNYEGGFIINNADHCIVFESNPLGLDSDAEKKKTNTNFKRAVKKYLLSPEEILIRDIIK